MLCVLLIDSNTDDSRHVLSILDASENITFTHDMAVSVDDAHRAIADEIYDVILIADRVGGWHGVDFVGTLDHDDPYLPPLIMLAGEDDREADLAAQRAGLADYLVKGQLTPPLLERSIRYALERKQSEQRLLRLAFNDSLTGLPNRASFKAELEDRIKEASLINGCFALLLLDLDHFKDVNDTLGHPVGDLLLQAVSQRLKSTVEANDFVARLGGDEFVVCTHSRRKREEIEELARRIVANLAEEYPLNDNTIKTATSIGIAIFPDHGRSYPEMLKHADLALYRAKDNGRGTSVTFETSMTI